MGGVFENIEVFAETKFPVPVWCVSVSPSGILAGLDDGTIVLLRNDLVESQRVEKAHHDKAITQLQWAADGLHFLSCGIDANVRVWVVGVTGVACVYALKQPAPLVSALFHPMCIDSKSSKFIDSSSSPPSMLFVVTGDKRLSGWVNGQLELYEALPVKDPPVCMAVGGAEKSSGSRIFASTTLIAIGTKSGELLVYEYSSEHGIVFLNSLACRNRRGPYSGGTPIVAIDFITDSDLLVSSQDNRIRLVHIEKSMKKSSSSASYKSADQSHRPSTILNYSLTLSIVQKFRGHKSSLGESPLGAFVLHPANSPPVMQVGSECGRIYAWSLPELSGGKFFARKRSIFKRFARKFKPSRAIKSSESWVAVGINDKLTAVAPGPWNSSGGTCTVTASLEGCVRLFMGKFIVPLANEVVRGEI
jgi:WD40 repeat protein